MVAVVEKVGRVWVELVTSCLGVALEVKVVRVWLVRVRYVVFLKVKYVVAVVEKVGRVWVELVTSCLGVALEVKVVRVWLVRVRYVVGRVWVELLESCLGVVVVFLGGKKEEENLRARTVRESCTWEDKIFFEQ